ncbi:PAS domain S-box protein [Candidatus Poribacteria bacterium]|nr:PAS domain S-box protein [Candidatus Poribacteria bacterium]
MELDQAKIEIQSSEIASDQLSCGPALQQESAHRLDVTADLSFRLQSLYDVSSVLNRDMHLNKVLRTATKSVQDGLGASVVKITFVDEDAGEFWEAFETDHFDATIEPRQPRWRVGTRYTGKVIETNRPIIANDTDQLQDSLIPNRHSFAIFPLRYGEKLIGTLKVARNEYRPFTESEIRFLEATSNQIGAAIERGLLYEAERKKAGQLALVDQIATEISSILDPAQLLDRVISHFHPDQYWAAIGLVEGDWLSFKPDWELPDSFRLQLGKGITGRAALTGEPQLVPDVTKDPDYIAAEDELARSECAVPLKVKNRVIGVLDFQSHKVNDFSQDDLQLFSALATHLAIALDNALTHERLAQSEERYKTIVESSLDGIAVVQNRKIVFADAAALEILGYEHPEELMQVDVSQFLASEGAGRGALMNPIVKKIDGEKAADRYEVKVLKKDGTSIDVEARVGQILYEGKPAIQASFRDITERRKSEEQLRYQAMLLENVNDAIISTDFDYNVISWNAAAERIFGWKAEGVIGKDLNIFRFSAKERAYIEDMMIQHGSWEGEYPFNRADGTQGIGYLSAATIRNSGGNAIGYVGVITDLTQQKQMEQQLFQSEKMASLGQLIAGVAHEINNPLSFIVSNQNNFAEYVQELTALLDAYTTLEALIQQQVERSEIPQSGAYDLLPQSVAQLRERKKSMDFDYMRAELAPMLESSHQGLQRITEIVKALRLFAHPEREEWIPYNLHEGIDSCVELLRFQVGERIQIQKDYGEVPTLYVKGNQMNQVFMNLFSNSIQLGLSLSYRMIEAHGGVIAVHSTVGTGTIVHVELPINVKRETESLVGIV